MKIAFLLASLLVVIAVEIYTWFGWISPFFWSPGVAYTDLAWGWFIVLAVFVLIPAAIIEEIVESVKGN